MAQEIESLLTGLTNGITKYLDLGNQMQISNAQAQQKLAGEMKMKKFEGDLDLENDKALEEYKSHLSLSSDLQNALLKKQLKKGEMLSSSELKKSVPGLEFLPDGVDLQPGPVLTYITNMNKTKNKPLGKIPASLIAQEATLNAQEAMLGQIEEMLKNNQAGIKGGLNSAVGSITRGNVGFNPVGIGGVSADEASKARNYNQLRKAAAVMAYRTATGDTRLSDQDAAERGYPLLPDLSEPTQVRNKKMDLILTSFKKAKAANIAAQRKAMAQSPEPMSLGDDNPYSGMSNDDILKALQSEGVIGE